MNALIGQTSRFDIANRTISGISCIGRFTAAAVNTQLLANDFDGNEITVKVDLIRGGRTFNLCNDDLRTLSLATNFDNGAANSLLISRATDPIPYVAVAHAAAVKAEVSLPLYINFAGVINLRSDDKLAIEMKVGSSAVSTDIDKSSVSYFEVDAIDAVGVESFTPYINTITVKSGEDRQTFSLGNNVQKVHFLNFDETTLLTADNVIDQVSINSDRFNVVHKNYDLVSTRATQFPTATEANYRAQSFELLDGEDFDNVKLDFTFKSANLAASKNKLVYQSYYTDERILTLASATKTRHEARAAKKYGIRSASLDAQENRANIMKHQYLPKRK